MSNAAGNQNEGLDLTWWGKCEKFGAAANALDRQLEKAEKVASPTGKEQYEVKDLKRMLDVLNGAAFVLAVRRIEDGPSKGKLKIDAYAKNVPSEPTPSTKPPSREELVDQVQIAFSSFGVNSCTGAQMAGSWYSCG